MKKLTKEQVLEVVEKYQSGNYSCTKLAKIYGVYPNAINGLLRRRGIKIKDDPAYFSRKYVLNEHYFDNIDTEAKAYFLGLLYADGCNYKKVNSVCLSLQEEDKEILDRFNKEIGSNKPLSTRDYAKRINPNYKKQYAIYLTHENITKKLTELGCVPAKSLILNFPTKEQVPECLIHHFIRGYFDGDGSFSAHISKKSKLKYDLSITSAKNFIVGLHKITLEKIGVDTYIMATKHAIKHNKTTRIFKMGGKSQIYKFLDWIYQDATIYLERKYQKYIRYKNPVSKKLNLSPRNKNKEVKI